jgi:hypothetical protein
MRNFKAFTGQMSVIGTSMCEQLQVVFEAFVSKSAAEFKAKKSESQHTDKWVTPLQLGRDETSPPRSSIMGISPPIPQQF